MNAEMAFLQMSGLLAAEVAAVVLIAMFVERFVRSAHWRRTIWQACALSILLVTFLELSGAARSGAGLLRRDTPRNDTRLAVSIEPIATLPIPAVEPVVVTTTATATPRAVKGTSQPMVFVFALAWLWILGAGVLLCRVIVSRTMLLVMCGTGRRLDSPALMRIVLELAPRLGIRGPVRIMEFTRLKGPMAFGLTRRIIGLPSNFETQHSRAQQEVILAHELAHLAARDSWWQLLAEIAVAALWWHPLVWLGQRRLQDASETAADESSLLVQNGPPVLAESLLALGKRLEVRPGLGWLNVAGFRSGLGQRVQRLFELRGAWTPASKVHTTLAQTFCPAVVVLGTVLCSGWISPDAAMKGTQMKNPIWKRSLPAFMALALLSTEQPSAAAEKPAAPTKAVSPADAKPGIGQKGKGAAMVRRKLEQITFPNFQSDNLPLGEVIRILIDESAKRDLGGVGVNLLLNPFDVDPAPPPIDPATGLPIAGGVPESVDLSAVTVRVMPPVKNVRLIDVLDAIVKMSDRPLKYSIEDYGVVITHAKRRSAMTLEARTFQIDPPDKLYKGLQSAFGIEVSEASDASGIHSREAQQQAFQELFLHLGVEWGAPRSIFFNELNGIVMVRATQEEMSLITAAMQTLGGHPIEISATSNSTTTVRK
jgi:beta-lactamase regulating signal transducer with metallopeptidase domain